MGCSGMLDLQPMEKSEPEPPILDYNFMYRINSIDTVTVIQDSIKVNKPVLIELYLLPFDTLGRDQLYVISFNLNEQMDADLMYKNRSFRANDPIVVRYSEFINRKLYMGFVPLNKGKIDLTFSCRDESGRRKIYKKEYVVGP